MLQALRRTILCATFLATIAGNATAQGQSQALIDRVKAVIAADTPRLEATFKDLHGNPELAFTETRTAGIVAAELRRLGFAVTTGIGKTGVVGVLKNGPGSTLWSRCSSTGWTLRRWMPRGRGFASSRTWPSDTTTSTSQPAASGGCS